MAKYLVPLVTFLSVLIGEVRVDVLSKEMVLTEFVPHLPDVIIATRKFTVDISKLTYSNVGTESIPPAANAFETNLIFAKYDQEVVNGFGDKSDPAKITLDPADMVNAGLNAGKSFTVTGTVDVTLPVDKCQYANYVCAKVQLGSIYPNEDSKSNNLRCVKVTSSLSCGIDIEVKSLSGVDVLYGWGPRKNTPFKVQLNNTADPTKQGANIPVASGAKKNYEISAFLSKTIDGANKVDYDITVAIGDDQLRRGLTGGKGLSLDGTADYPILLKAVCDEASLHLCVSVKPGIGANFIDTTTTNDILCVSLTKICYPDPIVTKFSITTSDQVFVREKKRKIGFDYEITNDGTAPDSDIPLVHSPNVNFEIVLKYLTDDRRTYISNQESDVVLADGLAVGNSISGSGNASVSIPSSMCQDIDYICAYVRPGTGASYVDNKPDNGYNCENITGKVVCSPDVNVVTFKRSDNVVFSDTATSVAKFNTKISNIGQPGNSIFPVTGNGKYNFEVMFLITDGDLRTATSSNIYLTVPAQVDTIANLQSGLDPGSEQDLGQAKASVTLPRDTCSKCSHACVKVVASDYYEDDINNNIMCSTTETSCTSTSSTNVIKLSGIVLTLFGFYLTQDGSI